jgi:hypothetical protein
MAGKRDIQQGTLALMILKRAGRKRLAREAREWHQPADLIAAFLSPRRETP